MTLLAIILVSIAVGLITWYSTKRYFERLIRDSDRDWNKELRDIRETYDSQLDKKDIDIQLLKQNVEDLGKLAEDRNKALDKAGLDRIDLRNRLEQSKKIVEDLLKDKETLMAENEKLHDIHEQELQEAADYAQETIDMIKKEWSDKYDKLKEENDLARKLLGADQIAVPIMSGLPKDFDGRKDL